MTSLDLEKEWTQTGPAKAKGQSISQLLNLTYTTLITKDQTRLLRDPFYKDYAGTLFEDVFYQWLIYSCSYS